MSFVLSDTSGVVYEDTLGNSGGLRAGTMAEVISGEDVSFSTISLYNQHDTSLNRVCLETDQENRLIAGKDVTFEVSKRNYDVSGTPIAINSGGGFHTRITGHGTDVHMNTYRPNRGTLFSGEPELLSYATYDPSGDALTDGAINHDSIYTTDAEYNVSRFHGVCTDSGGGPKNLIVTSGEVAVNASGDSIPGLRFLVRDGGDGGADVSYCDISNAWTVPVVEMAAETLDITEVVNGGATTMNLCNDNGHHAGHEVNRICQTFTATKTGMIDHVRWCPDFGAIWGGTLVRVKKLYDDDDVFNGKYTPYNDADATTQEFWVARTSYGTVFNVDTSTNEIFKNQTAGAGTNARKYKLITHNPYITGDISGSDISGTPSVSEHNTDTGRYEDTDTVTIEVEAGETYMLDMHTRVCATGIYGVGKTTNMNLCATPETDEGVTTYTRKDHGDSGRHYRPYPIQIFVNNSDSITGLADDGNLLTIGTATGDGTDVSGSYLTFHDVSNGLGKIRMNDDLDTEGKFGLDSYRSLDWQSSLGYCGADGTATTTHHYHLISISESDDHVVKTYDGEDLLSAEEFKHGIMFVARLTLDANNTVRITKSRIAGYRRKRVGNDHPRLIGRNSHIRGDWGFITEFDPVVKKISFVRFDIEKYLDGDAYTRHEYNRWYVTTHRRNNGYTPLQRSVVTPPRTREFRYINNANLGIQYAVDDSGMWVAYPEINTEVADSPEARLFHMEECYSSKFAPIGSIPLGTSSTDYHIAMFPDISLYVDATGAGIDGVGNPQIYIGISRAIFKYESAERSLKIMTSDVSVYRTPANITTCQVCGDLGLDNRMCDCMEVSYVGTHDHDMYDRPHKDGFLGLSHAIVADGSGNPMLLSSYIPCPPDTGRRTYLVRAGEQLEDFFRYREWFFANISTQAEVVAVNANRMTDGSGFQHDTNTTILPVPDIHVLPVKDVPEITFDVSVLGNMSVGGVVYANDFVVRNTSANKLSVKHQLHANSVSAARINVHELYVENQPYMWRDASGVLDRRGDAEVQTLDVLDRSDMWGDVSFNSDMEVRGRMYLNRNGRPVELQVAADGKIVEGVAPGTDVSFQTIELSGNLVARDPSGVATKFMVDVSNDFVQMDVSNVWVEHDMAVKGAMVVVGAMDVSGALDVADALDVSGHTQLTDISAGRLELMDISAGTVTVAGQTIVSDISAVWLDATDISAVTLEISDIVATTMDVSRVDVSGVVVRDTLDASRVDVSGVWVRDTLDVAGHTQMTDISATNLWISDISAGTMDVSRVDVSGVVVRDTLDASRVDVSGAWVRDTLDVSGHAQMTSVGAVTLEITERIVVGGTMDASGGGIDISGEKLWLGDTEGSYYQRQTAIDALIEDISGVSGSGIVELSKTLTDLSGAAIRTTGGQTIAGNLEVSGNVRVDTDPTNGSHLANKGYVDTEISALKSEIMGDLPAATLNTLTALADALGDDHNYATTVTGQIGQLESSKATRLNPDLSGHMKMTGTAEFSGDVSFNGDVVVASGKTITYENQTLDVRFANKSVVDVSFVAHATRDDTLQGNIDDVSGNLDTEISGRKSGDTTLQANINVVATDLDAEINDRKNADDALDIRINDVSGNLDAEISGRVSGDNALGGRIDTEESTRAFKDTELKGRIDVLDGSFNALNASKFDKSGGTITDNVTLDDDKYLTFGSGGAKVKGNSSGTLVLTNSKPFTFKGTADIMQLTDTKTTVFGALDVCGNMTLTESKLNVIDLSSTKKSFADYIEDHLTVGPQGPAGVAAANNPNVKEHTDGMWMKHVSVGGANRLNTDVALDVEGTLKIGSHTIKGNDNWFRINGDTGNGVYTGNKILSHLGNVGIGTLNPQEKLEVIGTVKAASFNGNLTGTVTTAAQPNITSVGTLTSLKVGKINMYSKVDSNTNIISNPSGSIELHSEYQMKFLVDTNSNQSSGADYIFQAQQSGNSTARDLLIIKQNGNVGIGTDDPKEKLDVVGNVKMNELWVGSDETKTNGPNDAWNHEVNNIYFARTFRPKKYNTEDQYHTISTKVYSDAANNYMAFNIWDNDDKEPKRAMKIDGNGKLEVSGNIKVTDGAELKGTTEKTAMLVLPADHTKARTLGPNKIKLYGDGNQYGFGIDGFTTTYHSHTNHAFFHGSGTANNLGMELNDTNLTVAGTVKATSFDGELTSAGGRHKIYLNGNETRIENTDRKSSMRFYNNGGDYDFDLHTDGNSGGTEYTALCIKGGDYGSSTAGNVGIGTDNPKEKLDVNGNVKMNGGTVDGVLNLNGGTATDSNVDDGNKTNTYIRFGQAGSGSDWAYLRQIGGDNAQNIALDFHDDHNDGGFVIRRVDSARTNPDIITNLFKVQRGGNVGIGTDNPQAKLHVNGTVKVVDIVGESHKYPKISNESTDSVSGQIIARGVCGGVPEGLYSGYNAKNTIRTLQIDNNPPLYGERFMLNAYTKKYNLTITSNDQTISGIKILSRTYQTTLTYWKVYTIDAVFDQPIGVCNVIVDSGTIGNYYFQSTNLTANSFISTSDDRLKTDEYIIENATDTLTKLRPQTYVKHAEFVSRDSTDISNSSSLSDTNVPALREMRVKYPTTNHLLTGEPELAACPGVTELWELLDISGNEIDDSGYILNSSGEQIHSLHPDPITNPVPPKNIESGLIAQEVYYGAPELRHLVMNHPTDTGIDPPTMTDNIQTDPDYGALGWSDKPSAVNYIGLIPYLIKSNQELHARINELEEKIDAIYKK